MPPAPKNMHRHGRLRRGDGAVEAEPYRQTRRNRTMRLSATSRARNDWGVVRRKAAVVAAMQSGKITLEEACQRRVHPRQRHHTLPDGLRVVRRPQVRWKCVQNADARAARQAEIAADHRRDRSFFAAMSNRPEMYWPTIEIEQPPSCSKTATMPSIELPPESGTRRPQRSPRRSASTTASRPAVYRSANGSDA